MDDAGAAHHQNTSLNDGPLFGPCLQAQCEVTALHIAPLMAAHPSAASRSFMGSNPTRVCPASGSDGKPALSPFSSHLRQQRDEGAYMVDLLEV